MKRFFYQSALLLESHKEGKEWDVVLIQAGLSLNNKFYPAEVLKRSIKLFENAKAFAFEFQGKAFNHLPDLAKRFLPEGCIKNLVGWYDNPRYGTFKDEDGKTQEGILARLHISENASWLRDLLKDAWEYGKKSLLGFSIDGDGKVSESQFDGRKVFRVDDIRCIDSVDIVTHPAAGGQLVRLLASISSDEEKEMDFLKKLYEAVKRLKESAVNGMDPEKISVEQEISLIKTLVESDSFLPKEFKEQDASLSSAVIDRLIEMITEGKNKEAVTMLKSMRDKMNANGYGTPVKAAAAPAPAPAAAPASVPANTKEAQKLMDEMSKKKDEMDKEITEARKMRCEAMLEKALAESNLFEPVKAKVRKQYAGKVFEQSELTESIKAETEVLAKLSESGHVKGLGGNKIEVIADEVDKLQAHLDLLIDPAADIPAKLKESVGTKSAFRSIKAAYIAFNPDDSDITFCRKRSNLRLTENITTGDFSYALGTSMNKRMGKEFAKIPFIFEPIVEKIPLDNFKQQEVIRWGGFSTLPTVAERGTYTDLMEPSDEKATYTPGKKGGVVYVTRETIKNDDMGFIRKIPTKINSIAMRTLQRFISGLLVDNGTYIPGNTAVFTAAYGNYTTNAFSHDHLIDGRKAMKQRRERGTIQSSGTATSATSTTLCDTANTAIVDDAFNAYYIRIVYGTGAGQSRLISDTATSGSTITVSTAWTTNPTSSSKYEISKAANDDEKIGLLAKHIIYGDSIESNVNSEIDSEYNPEDAASNQINENWKKYSRIYNPFLDGTSAYYWFLAADKADCDIIQIGFIDGKETPELLLQDDPKVGNNFSADEITYKIRHEFGGNVTGNEGLYGSFATNV